MTDPDADLCAAAFAALRMSFGSTAKSSLGTGSDRDSRSREPRAGRTQRYQDLAEPADTFSCALEGRDPRSTDNRNLQWMYERQLPLIYFYGLEPARYAPLFPVKVTRFDPERMVCEVTPDAEFTFLPVAPTLAAARKTDQRSSTR